MIITASVRSQAFKPRSEKKIAKALKCEPCLSQMCGSLQMQAEKPSEFDFLRELYAVVNQWGEGGKVVIFDKDGKERGWLDSTERTAESTPKPSPALPREEK